MKFLILITAVLTTSACTTFKDSVMDMTDLANQCAGIVTLTAEKSDAREKVLYTCTWSKVDI